MKLSQLPFQLSSLYLPQQQFFLRFVKKSRFQDPFGRICDICIDSHNNYRRVAIKDYSTTTQQQISDVLLNLTNFKNIEEETQNLCKLLGFCQIQNGKDIMAAFDYEGQTLEQLTSQHAFDNNRNDYYLFLLKQLLFTIQCLNNLNIDVDELIPSNILLQNHQNHYKLKMLYDEREKTYDKIKEGSKIFGSPAKISSSINREYNQQQESGEFIFQIGLLMLDLVYEYEMMAIAKTQQNREFSLNLFKQSYLLFEGDKVSLNQTLIQQKIKFLLGLNSPFITAFAGILSKIVINTQGKVGYTQLLQQINAISLMKEETIQIQLTQKVIKTSSIEVLHQKQSSPKIEDSLKYSQVSIANGHTQQLPSASTIQTKHKAIKPIVVEEHSQTIKVGANHLDNDFRIKLSEIKKIHEKISIKLQKYIEKLQYLSLTRKDYFDHSSYYGEIDQKNQKRSGQGIYFYYQGDIYFGTWNNNLLIEGTYIFKNGECFEGTVRKGKQGWGRYYYLNGNIYSGDWKDDLKEGKGLMVYSNGDRYEGTWFKGKKNGEGVYHYNDGTVYKGSFLNGKKAGFGVIVFPNKTKIQGYWSTNFVEGKGKIIYHNGNVYEGHFQYSQKQGNGTYRWSDDYSYDGQFKNDQMDGEGLITYPEGECYQGRIRNGKKEGFGLYRYLNGDQFKGHWRNDEKVQGIYKFNDGRTFEGRFNKTNIVYGVMIYPNEESYEGQFFNGERHGMGIYRKASGEVVYEGLWEYDRWKSSN